MYKNLYEAQDSFIDIMEVLNLVKTQLIPINKRSFAYSDFPSAYV